ncbi:low molecular weight protein-tyrosine-phosphatase [Aquabacterium sp.]|uniref:low molecular weight protein-tyrosine-phosphatase n=1 Tax=Aquabacterium sp. TaxID=1872578 RepID=UPI0035B21109
MFFRPAPEFSILMVCMGNICRSPTAEGVLRHKLRQAGLHKRVLVDSAGTIASHAGEAPDPRAQSHALRRGYELADLRARQVQPADFMRFDWLLAMDHDNLAWLRQACTPEHQGKLKRLLEFAPQLGRDDVPDPYYGGPAGFEAVLDLVETACDELVRRLQAEFS